MLCRGYHVLIWVSCGVRTFAMDKTTYVDILIIVDFLIFAQRSNTWVGHLFSRLMGTFLRATYQLMDGFSLVFLILMQLSD